MPKSEPRQIRLENSNKKINRLRQVTEAFFWLIGGYSGIVAIVKIANVTWLCPAVFYPLDAIHKQFIEIVCHQIANNGISLLIAYGKVAWLDIAITAASATGVRLLAIRYWRPNSEDKLN